MTDDTTPSANTGAARSENDTPTREEIDAALGAARQEAIVYGMGDVADTGPLDRAMFRVVLYLQRLFDTVERLTREHDEARCIYRGAWAKCHAFGCPAHDEARAEASQLLQICARVARGHDTTPGERERALSVLGPLIAERDELRAALAALVEDLESEARHAEDANADDAWQFPAAPHEAEADALQRCATRLRRLIGTESDGG